jgi:cobalt-zinc-cadmium efflux system membrane fusion protein
MTIPALSIALILALVGCGKSAAHTAPSDKVKVVTAITSARMLTVDPQLITTGRIVIAAAEERNPNDEVMISGQVVAPPRGKAEIGALMTARVRSVLVQEGDIVRAGAVLATLDAPDAARIFGDLAAARARRARADTVLSQEKALAEQHATSARAVSEATSDAESARADEVTATMLLQTYNVKGTTLTLKSPIAGVVAASHAQIGAQVDAGTILFKVVDTAKLNIRADVPESLADAIHLGVTGHLRFPTTGRVCASEVVASTRSVDPIKRTVSFRLQPSNPCQGLLEGGFVDVQLPLGSATSIVGDAAASQRFVTVPRSAVVEIDGVPVAFQATESPGKFKLTTLTIVRHGDSTSLIEKGLQNGDRIVVNGALLLKGEWLRSRLE